MNGALPMMVFFAGLPVASLQSYGQSVLTLLERLVSGAQTWVRASAGCQRSVLVAAGAAGAGLLMFVYGSVLLIRARRETRKAREALVKLAALRQVAESANEASANLLAGMIPLIRTPINAIVGFFDLALKTGLDPELHEHLDAVRTSADWLSHIANDAHELSRIEAGKLQLSDIPFSISECLLSAMKLMEPEASARKLVTDCKIDPRLPELVCGDPTRLRYLIFNLLDYAVSFSGSGNIILSAALESISADDVLVRVAVTGTGVEIPPAERLLTLEPFGQADAGVVLKSDATDFGLVISRRLVDLMGGSMECQSELGVGSTFEFTVRFRKQKTAAEAGAPVLAPESVGLKELSILVAEDNSLHRRLTTKDLESAGHRVWVAANVEEVAHNVQTEGFDLILMDSEMPGSLETAQAIRAAEAPGLRVPICALTTHASPTDRNRWEDAGIDGFIAKPIVVDEVLQLVSKLGEGTANTNGFDIALDTGGEAPIAEPNDWLISTERDSGEPDSGENILREVNQGAEIASCLAGIEASYDNSDDSEPSASAQLSVPAGLALLEVTQDDGPTPGAQWDPFEQARKSLSSSRFGVRVIHSDGDPSDRNLI